MINNLKIKNFKAIKDETFIFKNLTILAGTNSSGKSSTIQALLLCSLEINREYNSALANYLSFLRRDKISLLNFNVGARDFIIEIDEMAQLSYKKSERSFDIKNSSSELAHSISYQNGNLIYLCADRIGTREFYAKNDNPDI